MGVGRVTRRAKEVFISKSVRPYRVSASTVVTLHYCCHPALSRMTVYRNQLSRSSQPWSSCGPAPVLLHCICRLWELEAVNFHSRANWSHPQDPGEGIYPSQRRTGWGAPLGSSGLLFTPQAMVIAQMILVAPIVAALTRQTIEDLWTEYRDELTAMGIGPAGRAATLTFDARFSLVTALLAGFGRAAAEVGAVLIVGGNIDGFTRTMTTAITLETSKGDLPLAIGLGLGADRPERRGQDHAAAAHHGADPAHERTCDLGRPRAGGVHTSRLRVPAADDAAPQRRRQYPLCARRRRRATRATGCPRARTRRARRSCRARPPASAQALRRRATAACARTRARQGAANPP